MDCCRKGLAPACWVNPCPGTQPRWGYPQMGSYSGSIFFQLPARVRSQVCALLGSRRKTPRIVRGDENRSGHFQCLWLLFKLLCPPNLINAGLPNEDILATHAGAASPFLPPPITDHETENPTLIMIASKNWTCSPQLWIDRLLKYPFS